MMQLFQDSTKRASFFYVNDDKRIALRVAVTGQAGDIVTVAAQVEVTNDTGVNVGIGLELRRSTDAQSLTGTRLMPAVMENCTPDVHHKVFHPCMHDTLPSDGTHYYTVIMYGVATQTAPNDYITIEEGFGKISALVHGA